MRSILLSHLMLLGCFVHSTAQHLNDIVRHQGWLSGSNAAGLHTLADSLRLTDAAVSYQFGRGGLTDYFTPQHSIQWRGEVQSLFRYNAQTVLSGSVSYSHSQGYEMAGSAWIDPTDKPFDIVEYTEGREGRKILEQYKLHGAVAHTLGEWTAGLRGKYETANYAKQRDLRHQNRWMYLSITPGVTWNLGPCEVGASYSFRRNTEGISFNIAGTTGQQYITLITYGAFLGMREYSETVYDGYSSTSSGDRPIVDQWNGGALQFHLKQPDCHWYNEIAFDHRAGYYGRETSYTIVYEDHEGNNLAWHTTLGMGHQTNNLWKHLFTLQAEYCTLDAKERLWNEVQKGGGFTEYVYYDHQQRLDRTELKAEAEYEVHLSDWMLQAGIRYWQQEQRVSYYPVYRDQKISQFAVSLLGKRQGFCHGHGWEASLGLQWQQGDGTMADDGTYNGATATTRVVTQEHYLRQAFDYRTGQQGSIQLSLRYSHPLRWYLAASHSLRHSFEPSNFINPTYNTLSMALGYEF